MLSHQHIPSAQQNQTQSLSAKNQKLPDIGYFSREVSTLLTKKWKISVCYINPKKALTQEKISKNAIFASPQEKRHFCLKNADLRRQHLTRNLQNLHQVSTKFALTLLKLRQILSQKIHLSAQDRNWIFIKNTQHKNHHKNWPTQCKLTINWHFFLSNPPGQIEASQRLKNGFFRHELTSRSLKKWRLKW